MTGGPAHGAPAVLVEGLSKRYGSGEWALRDVSLDVAPGQALALLGHDGSGKTTLLRVLARVVPPTSGRAVVRGRVAPLLILATRLLDGSRSVQDNVGLICTMLAVPRDEIERLAPGVIEFAGLEGRERDAVTRLSAGQLRRLAMALVLCLEPDVLLVDEVIAIGDTGFRERCTERLEELLSAGATLLFATHDTEEAARFCDEAVLLDAGRIVDRGAVPVVVGRMSRTAAPPAETAALAGIGRLLAARLVAADGEPIGALGPDEGGTIAIRVELDAPASVRCSAVAAGGDGEPLAQAAWQPLAHAGEHGLALAVPAGALPPGRNRLTLTVAVAAAGGGAPLQLADTLTVEVLGERPGRDDDDEDDEL